MSNRNYILNREAVEHKLQRLALELAENLSGQSVPIIIIGIRKNGMVLAEKISSLLKKHIPNEVKTISASLDKVHPVAIELSESMDFNNTHIILVDDVTNSGRTLLYALKPLLVFHPKSIQTLVLVERMHKLFPVKPDYVGLSVATTLQEHIQVEVTNDIITGAYTE